MLEVRCVVFPAHLLSSIKFWQEQMRENYTKIPNEILEALARMRFRNYEFRYIFVLLRKTLGFHKRSDRIANKQFVKSTGIGKWHISHTQKRLIEAKVVTRRGNKLSLNLNYGEWKLLPNRATVASWGGKVASRGGHKRNYTKENISSSKRGKISFKKEDYNLLLKEYEELKGISLQGQEVKPVLQAIKSMFLSGRTTEQILACMQWCASEWPQKWTIGTVQRKIPEFVAGKFTKDDAWEYAQK